MTEPTFGTGVPAGAPRVGEAPPVAVVSGASPLGETSGSRLAQAASHRVLGRWRWLPLATILVVGGAWMVLVAVIRASGGSSDLVTASGVVAVVVLFVAMGWASRHVRRLLVRRWLQRGVPTVNTLTYAVDDEALTVSGAISTTRLNWAGVSEVAPAGRGVAGKGYWIVLAAGMFYYLPRRLFASPQDEAAFLAAMLARMTPQARARSVEARKLTAFE